MSTIKQGYAASSALTITLASLASDATNVTAGRSSAAVDNTSNLYLDYLLSAKITVGTTPTVNTKIEVWVYAQLEDTPTYPDTAGGADANVTFTSRAILFGSAVLAATLDVDATTSNRSYYMAPTSVAQLFGGQCPKKFAAFVVHNTAVNLNATGGNHAMWIQPVNATVV